MHVPGSAAEIQGLLAKLAVNDTEADDDIRRNILLRKQAVGAIADFTCVQKDSVLGKTFLAGGVNKQHPILTLHDLLRQAIDMNGKAVNTVLNCRIQGVMVTCRDDDGNP